MVIPQIYNLLVRVGKAHPQSLILPLAVASKSLNMICKLKRASKALLDLIRFS